jgi:hypothetical protein
MLKRKWVAAVIAVPIVALVGVACDGGTALITTPTPVVTFGPEGGTVIPVPSRNPIAPVPADWVVFSNASFSVRHPPDWFAYPDNSFILSFDPASAPGPETFPDGGVKVQLSRVSTSVAGFDQRPPESSDTVLAGLPAWEVVRAYDRLRGVQYTHAVAVEVNGYRYAVGALFAESNPDETVFFQILSTVELK